MNRGLERYIVQTREWLRVDRNKYIAGGVAFLALMGAAVLAEPSAEGRRYADTRIEVDTRQGDVECFGDNRVFVNEGDTASKIVHRYVALIMDGVSGAIPDVEPIALAILERNNISQPSDLPANTTLRGIPDFCAFEAV